VGGFDVLSIQRSVVLRVEMGLSTDSYLIIYVAIPQYQFWEILPTVIITACYVDPNSSCIIRCLRI